MLKLFKKKKSKAGLSILYIMVFFLALASALPAYIQSSYIEGFVGLSAVNWFFITANGISIIMTLFFPRLIKKIGNYFTTGFVAVLFILALIGLGSAHNPALIFLFFIIMQVAANLIFINMDIFVENFSKDSSTGQTRTIYFTIINLAWVFSPNISAWLINLSGYYGVFLFSACLLIPFLLIQLIAGSKINGHFDYKKTSIRKTIKEMYKNRDLRSIFWLSMLLNVFYNTVVVFIPIYLNRIIGFSWTELGVVFSIMLVPFLLVEIPAGIISDKYLGEKEMFSVGYFLIIVTLLLSTSASRNLWFWAILLFVGRIGAALVEAMRESYFFKKVSAKDIDKINIFRTAIPFGYLVGSTLSLITLAFLPITYIFIFTALFMCSSIYFLVKLKDTK